jgi:two-component sensor histidine kinase
LTTNAVKYGALSIASGSVKVEWQILPANKLFLRWTETGGPPVKPPTRRGFGTRVMKRMICGQLNGELRFFWHEEGVTCEVTVQT